MTDEEKKLMARDLSRRKASDIDEVIDLIQKVVGIENIHVIRTQEDMEALTLEMELQEYLRSGGKLN